MEIHIHLREGAFFLQEQEEMCVRAAQEKSISWKVEPINSAYTVRKALFAPQVTLSHACRRRRRNRKKTPQPPERALYVMQTSVKVTPPSNISHSSHFQQIMSIYYENYGS